MKRIGRKKIALLGAGQIGGTLALLCGMRGLGDVVLYDIVPDMPMGKALDIGHLSPVFGFDFKIQGSNNLADIKDADVCIITSGIPRKPGMSRDDLLKTNAEIIRTVSEGIKNYAPNALVVIITNPLDVMAYLCQRITGFPTSRVIGMAGVLDTARYQYFLAQELGVSITSVSACVLGGHGDQMVPVRSYTNCGGVPISKMIPAQRLDEIEKRVRNAGGEIVNLLKSGSAFYSPAASAIEMVESYLFDQKKVLAAAAMCNGEYGVKGIYFGVPVVIGAGGVEKVLTIDLTAEETKQLGESAKSVSSTVEDLRRLIDLD